MSRYSVIAGVIIVAAVLYLGYVFLVTGGPARVEEGISAEEAAEGTGG